MSPAVPKTIYMDPERLCWPGEPCGLGHECFARTASGRASWDKGEGRGCPGNDVTVRLSSAAGGTWRLSGRCPEPTQSPCSEWPFSPSPSCRLAQPLAGPSFCVWQEWRSVPGHPSLARPGCVLPSRQAWPSLSHVLGVQGFSSWGCP